jgi:hypothetical protein
VRFIDIFYPVLIVITFWRQELRNRVNLIRTAATEGSGRETHRLTDFEFVHGHKALHGISRNCALPIAAAPGIQTRLMDTNVTDARRAAAKIYRPSSTARGQPVGRSLQA